MTAAPSHATAPAHATATLALVPHPATPAGPVQAVDAHLAWRNTGPTAKLELHYRVHGRIAALRVPAPQPPGPADNLWQHLCLEAFFSAGDGSYHEFNFSPSGQWAAYRFSAPRVRDAAQPGLTIQPQLLLARDGHTLSLIATLPLAALPRPAAGVGAWRVGLTAVIEPIGGPISYWALSHPAPKPDFHHADGWILPLTPPRSP